MWCSSAFKMSAASICDVCGKASRFKCSGCSTTFYCSKDHQKLDWKDHKAKCIAFEVAVDETLGRHLVAIRPIARGEVILREKALIEGPPQATPPICLGCYDLLAQATKVDCSKCGWPLCSNECEKAESHRAECEITARRPNGKVRITSFEKSLFHPSYQCLTILRCLGLKKGKPRAWKKLMNLESHCEQRKATPKYACDQIFIAKFIPEFFGLTEFSESDIQKVTGIVQVNAHEVPLKKPGYVAIFEKASLLEHNCRANCSKSFSEAGELVIRAAGNILPGDHLSICYTDPLWGRTARRDHLVETKFFFCRCSRCSDPTEFGTHFNSLKCRRDCDGFLVPVENEDGQTGRVGKVKCDKCNDWSTEEAEISENATGDAIAAKTNDLDSCLGFLKNYNSILHGNHHLMIKVKLATVDRLAWPGELPSVDDETLDWIICTCRQVCELAEILVPAENRLLGVLLYQLHFALMEKCQRSRGRASSGAFPMNENRTFLDCLRVLEEAFAYLKNEPKVLPEGMMAEEAKRTLENLKKKYK